MADIEIGQDFEALDLNDFSFVKKRELTNDEKILANHYAGLAMQALISNIKINNDEEYSYELVAKDAFNFAYAMVVYTPK